MKDLRTGISISVYGFVIRKKKYNQLIDLPLNGMFELNIDVTVTGIVKKYEFILCNKKGEKVDFYFVIKKDKLWNEYGLANSDSFRMDRRRYSYFLSNGEKNWGTHGHEKKLVSKEGVYSYTKNCYKYIEPFRIGTKIPMALIKINKIYKVQIFYDKSHIEVFLDGRRAVMTNVVLPNEGVIIN